MNIGNLIFFIFYKTYCCKALENIYTETPLGICLSTCLLLSKILSKLQVILTALILFFGLFFFLNFFFWQLLAVL